jgi:hypothetical protein
MLDVATLVCAVALVLLVFGLPLVAAFGPKGWRCWWPVSAPIYGLAGLAAIQLPLGTLFSPGATAVPALVLALLALVVAWRRYGGLPLPSIASVLVLAAVIPAGLLAYRPTLRLQEPRPSGVLNEDSIYYLSIDSWLRSNGIRDEPPPPHVDGFFAPAYAAWDNHLRVGVDLVNVQVSTILSVDPLETQPALAGVLVALIGASGALAVVALRGPPWAAVLVAVLLTTRPETLRLGLDSFLAQAAGIVLAPVAAVSLALALLRGERRWVLAAGIFGAALCAYYVEYAPWLALSGSVLLIVTLVMRPRRAESGGAAAADRIPSRRALLQRAGLVVILGVLSNPLAIYNGVLSLRAGAALTGEVIVPFFGLLRDLSLVTGPFTVLQESPEAALYLAVATTVIVLVALPHLPRMLVLVLATTLFAAAIFVLHQAYLQEYSYGLYKVLGLAAPLVALAIVLVLADNAVPAGIRLAAAAVTAGLLALNTVSALQISRLSVSAVNGMIPEDDDLRRAREFLPGVERLALEGTDTAGTPNARQHYGVYVLRQYNGLAVTYARGQGSYYLTALTRGPEDVDRTYSPDYGGVASWGPSLTQREVVAQLGGWHLYRRPDGPNLLLVGRKGWNFPTVGSNGRTLRWTRGPAYAWLNAEKPTRVRLKVEVAAPFRRQRLRMFAAGRELLSRSVPTSPTALRTVAFQIPRGRTVVSFQSVLNEGPAGGDPLGVGLFSAEVLSGEE